MAHPLLRTPIVASVQSSPGSAVEHPETLARLAQASASVGATLLRLQGVENIRACREAAGLPSIGLIKRDYADSPVYITPTLREVRELLETGTEVVALDATARPRPNGESLAELVGAIHAGGALAMADCDGVDSVRHAIACGADWIGTTLAGYTVDSPATAGPDLAFLREAVSLSEGRPVIAEGRYQEPWQAQAALSIGASAVVLGGVLNDPVKQTRRFLGAAPLAGRVGAVDLGGTWMRWAVVAPDGSLECLERTPLDPSREARLGWIRERVERWRVERVGVSTGGTVDPRTGEVWEAKPILPAHVGSAFSEATLGVPTIALNDGLATAWGHAHHPRFAGMRVATLALGTGVGAGCVDRGRILMGPRGEYPRLNDLPAAEGRSFEDLLGGAALSPDPSAEQRRQALQAFRGALATARALWLPDVVVVCGGVGLSPWLLEALPEGVAPSPYGSDAGLRGAAALARIPMGV